MNVLLARLAPVFALATLLAGCPDDAIPTTALPGGLDLAGLTPEHRALVSATLEISGGALTETPLVLGDDLTTVSGTFDVQNVAATAERTLTLRVYGRFLPTSDQVLLGRIVKPITLQPAQDVEVAFVAADVFDSCGGEAGACSVLFDANRNGASNIDDLLERSRSGGRGIDPAPQAPYLVTSSEQLQFPSGVRLGTFARQLVVLENFGENPVTISAAAVVGGQGFSISILDSTGLSVTPPGRALAADAFASVAAGQEAFVAVSFSPANSFVTTGSLFVRVQDQVTLVEQTVRVKLIANPEGAFRPADPAYTEPDLSSLTVDGVAISVAAFPNAQLHSGDALTAEDALGSGLRQTGASVALVDGDRTVAFPVDGAFVVDVEAGQRFSTSIDGLRSDVDLAVVAVDSTGAVTGLACAGCRSANAGISPEAIEFKSDVARRVVVLLGRIEPEDDAAVADDTADNEAALTVAETVSFRIATTVTTGPEFAALDPVAPTTGPLEGGIPVVVRGSGFHPDARVRVGDAEAFDVTIVRDVDGVDTVRFTLPSASGAPGLASIIVENPTGGGIDGGDGQAATLLEAFTYQPPAPVITEVQPDVAPTTGGTTPMIIAGRFFSNRFGPPQVVFGDVSVAASFVSASELRVTAPPRVDVASATTVSVKVRNLITAAGDDSAPGSASNGVTFRYVVADGPPPTLSSVSPSTGSIDGGTRVTLTGTGLRAGLQVLFGTHTATCDLPSSSTSVSCVTPASQAAAAIAVVLVNNDGQSAQLDDGYAYEIPRPSITSVFPTRSSAVGGTFLVVEGVGFRPGARVTFTQGETVRPAAAVAQVSSTTLLVTTPAGTAGEATITLTTLDNQTLTAPFAYFAPEQVTPAPSITALSPSSGEASGGYAVVISGTNFVAPRVVFGSTPVTVSAFVDRAGPGLDELTIVAPPSPNGVAGVVAVQVINDDGQASTSTFSYTFSAGAPTITAVSATDVHADVAGDVITIFGDNLDQGSLQATFTAPTPNPRILTRGRNVIVLELPALASAAAANTPHPLTLRFTNGPTTTLTVPLVAHRPVVVFDDISASKGVVDAIVFGAFFNPAALESFEFVSSTVRVPCTMTTATEQTIACFAEFADEFAGLVFVPTLTWRGTFNGVLQPPVEVTGDAIGLDDVTGPALCGNERIDANEQCDEGPFNGVLVDRGVFAGSPQLLCDDTCQLPDVGLQLGPAFNVGRRLQAGGSELVSVLVDVRSELTVSTTLRSGTVANTDCSNRISLTIEESTFPFRPLLTSVDGEGGCAVARLVVPPGFYTARVEATVPGDSFEFVVGASVQAAPFGDVCGDGFTRGAAVGGVERTSIIDALAVAGGLGAGVAVDSNDVVYVVQNAGSQHSIRRRAADGTSLTLASGAFSGGADLELGPDGFLYLADGVGFGENGSTSSNTVWRINPGTGAASVFINDVANPTGLAFGTDGLLYVAEFDARQIRRFSAADGAVVDVFATGLDLRPTDIEFGLDGQLYVAGFHPTTTAPQNSVFALTPFGAVSTFFSHAGAGDPHGLAFDKGGNLWVSTSSGGELLQVNADGAVTVAFSGEAGPNGIAIGRDDAVYVLLDSGTVDRISGVAALGTEQCDDGNSDQGDGCSRRCRSEGDVILAVGQTTIVQGNGSGGQPASDECEVGSVLVGLSARVGGVVSSVAAVCARTAIVDQSVELVDPVTLSLRGRGPGAVVKTRCSPGSGVVGFVGTADALIDSLEFACAPIVNTSGLAIGERVANSPRIGADNGQAFALTMCPSGQIARGINIRVGDNLDAFGLICGTLP